MAKQSARSQTYDISLPGNMFGELVLSGLGEVDVSLNGSQVNTAKGFISLASGANHVTVRINSF